LQAEHGFHCILKLSSVNTSLDYIKNIQMLSDNKCWLANQVVFSTDIKGEGSVCKQ